MKNDETSPYLTGKILLATPSMGDPRFSRAVIFICSHDQKGAMGLVINHTLPGLSFQQLVGQLKIQSDITVDLHKPRFRVMSGGPVESGRGFMLHTPDFQRHETVLLKSGFGVTGTVEALKDVLRGEGVVHRRTLRAENPHRRLGHFRQVRHHVFGGTAMDAHHGPQQRRVLRDQLALRVVGGELV